MSHSFKVLLLVLVVLSPSTEASTKWISTHHSKIFIGENAQESCEQEADLVFDEFPVEAAAQAEITLIDVICEPLAPKRVRLSLVHEHTIADEISTIVERVGSPAACQAAILPAREAFAGAGLAPVMAYCSGQDLVVDFIDPIGVSHDRYYHGPRFASRAECGARYLRLDSDFRAAGLTPLVGSCQEFKGLLDEKPYFVTSFIYAMPLGMHVSVLHARASRSLQECLGDFSAIRTRFAAAEIPVVDAYCAEDSNGFHQVLSYADALIGKLKTHEGPVLTDAARCEQTRERVAVTLAKQGNEILHSYCEEIRPFTAEPKGYRFRIHYTEIKNED